MPTSHKRNGFWKTNLEHLYGIFLMFPSVQKASNSFFFFLKQQYWISVSLVTDFKFSGLKMFFPFQSLLITKLSRRYLQLIFVLIGNQKEFNSNS